MQRGVQPVGEQGQRRPAGHLHQLGGAGAHARGQVAVLPAGGTDVEDGGAADRPGRGRRQVGQMPVPARVPPGGRARVQLERAEVGDVSRLRVDEVQPGGERTRLVLRAVPADHGQRAAARPLHHLDDMPVTESAHHRQFTRAQVEQPQPVIRSRLAPDHRVVAFGLPALVLRGRLVPGHDGGPQAAGQREMAGDRSSPVGQRLGSAAVGAEPVHLPVGDEPQGARIGSPSRGLRPRRTVGELPGR
jgi:hypothetical protein